MILTGNHIYTSGGPGTNAAVVRGALRAERPDLLTVILPQSLEKQPEELHELLSQVEDLQCMSENDDLKLLEASRCASTRMSARIVPSVQRSGLRTWACSEQRNLVQSILWPIGAGCATARSLPKCSKSSALHSTTAKCCSRHARRRKSARPSSHCAIWTDEQQTCWIERMIDCCQPPSKVSDVSLGARTPGLTEDGHYITVSAFHWSRHHAGATSQVQPARDARALRHGAA